MQSAGEGSVPGPEYKIGDIAALHKVSLRTLRFYEEKELITPRREGQLRFYSEQDRQRLDIITTAKRLGFSLAEIWKLIEARIESKKVDGATLCTDALGLTQEQIRAQLEYLSRERDRVHRAIEELRAALPISPSNDD